MTIKSASKALSRVASLGIDGPWKRYRMSGGSENRRWATTGILKDQIGADGRIVLEALSSHALSDIVIRVYTEDPLETHYARKASSPEGVQECITEAVAIFGKMPGEHPRGLGLLGGVFNAIFRGALNPLPPPFDIDEIDYGRQPTNTEQGTPPNRA